MSDTGLYAGLYHRIRECADLVDNVLIRLKEGAGSLDDGSVEELARLFTDLGTGDLDDLSTKLIGLVLKDRNQWAASDFARMGKALSARPVGDSIIGLLEQFARSLEQEQAGAMERLGG